MLNSQSLMSGYQAIHERTASRISFDSSIELFQHDQHELSQTSLRHVISSLIPCWPNHSFADFSLERN